MRPFLRFPTVALSLLTRPSSDFLKPPQVAPPALKEWIYPGDDCGQEFVYPKNRAVELAKASNQPVPSMPSNMSPNVTKPAKTSSDASVAGDEECAIESAASQRAGDRSGNSFNTKPKNGK